MVDAGSVDDRLYLRVDERLGDGAFAPGVLVFHVQVPLLIQQQAPDDRSHWVDVVGHAPIHSIADIEALPFAPRMVNIKPSRIGGLAKLCATYDYCAEHRIDAYGGGQFVLGVGRGQAQYLASLFHPDTPNDLAPSGYNVNDPPPGLPSSPLAPRPSDTGFRWEASARSPRDRRLGQLP